VYSRCFNTNPFFSGSSSTATRSLSLSITYQAKINTIIVEYFHKDYFVLKIVYRVYIIMRSNKIHFWGGEMMPNGVRTLFRQPIILTTRYSDNLLYAFFATKCLQQVRPEVCLKRPQVLCFLEEIMFISIKVFWFSNLLPPVFLPLF